MATPHDFLTERQKFVLGFFDSSQEVPDDDSCEAVDSESSLDVLAGDLVVCDDCHGEYIMEAESCERPEDESRQALHDAIPACPSCRDAIGEFLRSFAA